MSASDPVSQLGEALDLIGPLYRRAVRRLENRERAGGLPVGVRAVLDLLRQTGPRTVPQLAKTLGLTRQVVQRSVDDARARGLVRLMANPAHRRSSLVALTDEGREAVEEQRASERAVLQRVAGAVSPADVSSCVVVLRHLLAAVSEPAPLPTEDPRSEQR